MAINVLWFLSQIFSLPSDISDSDRQSRIEEFTRQAQEMRPQGEL